jgi:hypothetical protein
MNQTRPARCFATAFLCLGVMLLTSTTASALDGSWSELGTPNRANHSMIYDPDGERFIMYSGSPNDVWALTLNDVNPEWRRVITAGREPSARRGHTAIHDAPRNRMLVFGGAGSVLQNDVWALSIGAAPQWTRLECGPGPEARTEHSAIYDSKNNRLVIFGGRSDSTYLNDVWALSLTGTPAWTELFPDSVPPTARAAHSAIYDPSRDRMVVCGGASTLDNFHEDVWTLSFSMNSWSQLATFGEPPGYRDFGYGIRDAAAFYDGKRDQMVIAGGMWGYLERGGAWVLNFAGKADWYPLAGPGVSHAAMAFDPGSDRALLHGGIPGYYAAPYLTHIFSFDARTWSGLHPIPIARWSHAGVFDSIGNRMWIHGGSVIGCLDPCEAGDTWTFSLAQAQWYWAPYGSARYGHSAIRDPARNRMIIFGGAQYYGFDPNYNDTQGILISPEDPASTRWEYVVTTGVLPPARREHTAIYDSVRDRMVIFGGTSQAFLKNGETFNDVWALSLGGQPHWEQLRPQGTPPSPRLDHSAIYDPIGDRMLVFGGSRDEYAEANKELWSLSLSDPPTWSQLLPDRKPPASRSAHTALYDSARHRMLIHGGRLSNESPSLVWELSLGDRLKWRELIVEGSGPGLSDHVAVLDELGDRMLVHAGTSIWALQFGTVTAVDHQDAPTLALTIAGPSPVIGALIVSFTLPIAQPARLELLDVAGRRIVSSHVGGEPGHHRLTLAEHSVLSSGIYFIRLQQGSRSAVARVAILR